MEHNKQDCRIKGCGICDEYPVISRKQIKNEAVCALDLRFSNWVLNTRLTGEEREGIEDIYRDLKNEIDYLS